MLKKIKEYAEKNPKSYWLFGQEWPFFLVRYVWMAFTIGFHSPSNPNSPLEFDISDGKIFG